MMALRLKNLVVSKGSAPPKRCGTPAFFWVGRVFDFIIVFLCCLVNLSLRYTIAAEELAGLMSNEEEIEFGRVVDEEIRRHFSVCSSHPKDGGSSTLEPMQRVTEVGLKLSAVSDRNDIPYVFRILDSDTLNAFSAPGGYIYVTTGLIEFVKNTDELAGIMSHEVAHIALRHAAKMLKAAQIERPMLPDELDRMEKILKVFQYYKIEYEKEADLLGAFYAYKAGYNPNGLPDFMEAIMAESMRGRAPGFFSLILIYRLKWPERISALREYIATFEKNDN